MIENDLGKILSTQVIFIYERKFLNIFTQNVLFFYQINKPFNMKNKTTNSSVYDITIRMFFLFLIVAWCLFIMLPFVHILLWGMILGITFMPMHNSLTKIFGGKPKLASTVIVLLSLVIIIIPSMLFLDSVIHSIKELKEAYFHKT